MRFVFLHGGPGFNSFAEQAILGPPFQAAGHEIVFWNEPSRLRPAGEPFVEVRVLEHWLASAERTVLTAGASEPVHVISHSMSVHAARHIASRHPGCVASMVLVAAADCFACFCEVLRVAQKDLAPTQPEAAAAIAASLERTRLLLDDAMRDGIMNALRDDRLFTHYFAEAGQFRATMAARERPEAQFDLDSFFSVLADFAARGRLLLSEKPLIAPTLALFGAQDPITPLNRQHRALIEMIPQARIEVLDGCSHYLHLDRPRHFVDTVSRWAASTPTGGFKPAW
jgi:pimeloyl-ACP methyl ester carboxylesterase